MARLDVTDHDRYREGMTYVYPVVSRRAGGVSVGINLNPNDACNWRCVYCQVPDLVRGKGPAIELPRLREELRFMLGEIVRGDFLQTRVPEGSRRLNDVAFSGNGEPTSSPDFAAAVEVVGEVLAELELTGSIQVVLITNGSLAEQARVSAGIARLAALNGEVWFKLDRATREGLSAVNSTPMDPADHLRRLRHVAGLCPTWIQTCVFATDGEPPSDAERAAYLGALRGLIADGTPLRGVLLYGLARPSHQPEAPTLSPLPAAWLEALAAEIEALGLTCRVSV